MKSKTKKILIGFTLVVVAASLIFFAARYALNPVGEEAATSQYSSLRAYDFVDGEDVSDFVEASVWAPDDDATFDSNDDYYKLSNYEEIIKSTDFEDIELDLTKYETSDILWLEVNPDANAVYETMWIPLYGGSNIDRDFALYHLSSDVLLTMFDNDAGGSWDFTSDGNFTIYGAYPTYTTTDAHYGDDGDGDDGWETTQSEFDDLDTEDQEEFYNEKNYRCQKSYYNINNDDDHDYSTTWEQLTNVYAIKIAFNATISSTNGATTQVNATLSNTNWETVTSGQYLYIVCKDYVKTGFSLDLELSMNTHINGTGVYSGRGQVPTDLSSLTSFSAYSYSITA